MPCADQPGDIAVNIRSFHHAESFGGGFHGDGRGFSTDENASARIHSRAVVHEGPEGFSDEVESGGFSDPSYHPTSLPGQGPSLAVSTPTVDAQVTASDEAGVAVRMDYRGANPLTPPGTPDIDVHSAVAFRRTSPEHVQVDYRVMGDAFPNAEAFVTDHQGNSVFLGAHAIGADQGPGDLIGDDGHPMMEGSLTLSMGSDGVFRGVEHEGRKYTVDEWNARFSSQSPERS